MINFIINKIGFMIQDAEETKVVNELIESLISKGVSYHSEQTYGFFNLLYSRGFIFKTSKDNYVYLYGNKVFINKNPYNIKDSIIFYLKDSKLFKSLKNKTNNLNKQNKLNLLKELIHVTKDGDNIWYTNYYIRNNQK